MAAIMGDDDRTIVQGALDAAFPSRVTPVHSHGLHPDTITESTHHAGYAEAEAIQRLHGDWR